MVHYRIFLITNYFKQKGDNIIVADRETGTVKWFNTTKAYGFIERSNGTDIFVHSNSIRDKGGVLKEGDRVEFTVIKGKKGPQADDVVVLD
jgi:CspA family cold shock protein